MKEKTLLFVALLLSSTGAYFFAPKISTAALAISVSTPFTYNFTVDGSLAETGDPASSSSGYWWVNSGAKMLLSGGMGKTVQGKLPENDVWRKLYAANNPTDTDNGYHPQNIFRLVGRSQWQNFRQEAYFKITADNFSTSSNRNSSNGILLFNRYQDGNSLYYTGLRVDGYAVIKKKLNGTYSTLAYVKVLPGTYNRTSNPNLLPKDTWIGLRSEVLNQNGKVVIKLYTDIGQTGVWSLAATATDDGTKGAVIDKAGFGGIRTDFMDVSFDAYRIQNL
jgi:hypothetical protein